MEHEDNVNSSTDKLGVPRFAAANVDKINVSDVEQLISEVPTGTKVSTAPAQLKPTQKSNRRVLNRGTVFASHWLNTPLKDGEIYVSSAYQVIRTMAANYQRTHQDGFFEAWPGCLIKYSGEDTPETNVIRANFEDYSERLAHYAWHYNNAANMLAASLANLLILSRLNGNAMIKDIASDCKWSRVNTYTNMFARFPQPVGLHDFIAANSAYAIGKTSFGADILSIPMWICDIFGNRGCHSEALDAVITSKGGLGNIFHDANIDDPKEDGLQANRLLENMLDTIIEYGSDPLNVDGNTYHPRSPHVENGSVAFLQDSNGNMAMKLNADGYIAESTYSPDPVVTKNQISAIAWKNYMYWQDYMIRNFPEMLDPNSDIYVFFTRELKIIEPAKTPKAMLDIIHSLKNIDMIDLRESMKYKRNNAVTSSTIVKWSPLFGGSLAKGTARDNTGSHDFDRNFHRYVTHGKGTAEMLYDNSKYPRLTPTAFLRCTTYSEQLPEQSPDKALAPYVFNSLMGIGTEWLDHDPSVIDDNVYHEAAIQSPVGKFAYLLDLACTRLSDPEHGHVSALGITEDALKDFVDHANGIVFDEDPSNVRLFSQPLIDNTDPFQCGFNVIVSDKIETPDEFRWYKDSSQYGHAEIDITPTQIGEVTFLNEPAIADADAPDGYSLAHVINPVYLDKIRYALVFVGDGIFDHPYQNIASNTSGLPTYEVNMNAGNEEISDAFAAKWTDPRTATDPDNGYQTLNLMLQGAARMGTDDDVNPAGDTFCDRIRGFTKNTNDINIVFGLFNPAYGPVKIVAHSATDYAGKISVSIFKEVTDGPTQAALTPELVVEANIASNQAGWKNVNRQIEWDEVKFASRYWLEFLTEFQFNPSYFDRNYQMFITQKELPFDPIYLTDQGHTYRTFLALTTAQFCGCNKYNPFWSSDNISESRMKTLPPKLTTTFAMPENYVLAEPRVPRSTKSPDPNYGDVKAKTTSWKSRSNEGQASIEGKGDAKSHGSYKKHKSKNKFNQKPEKTRAPINADGVASSTDIGIKEGSGFDDSTLKDESTSKKFTKAGKKMTGVNTEL